MCRGKFSIFYYLLKSRVCGREYVRKIDKNCCKIANHQRKSHHIHAYHFSIWVCAHLHMMPICIASQARYTRSVHNTMLSQCTHVHTLYSIWIYEVNIISFYFISFFTIKISFIAIQSGFAQTPSLPCMCAMIFFINAKIVCLDAFSWEWIWSLVHCY